QNYRLCPTVLDECAAEPARVRVGSVGGRWGLRADRHERDGKPADDVDFPAGAGGGAAACCNAPDDFLQPTTSQFCVLLQNGGPLMSDDAVNDHRYLPSNTAFDRLVNDTHDYYDKVPQMDLDPGQAEHSYAYLPAPARSLRAHSDGRSDDERDERSRRRRQSGDGCV
ncbi:hypothetical protein PENTCL1PPCAC_30425, partial [Pristionchus entomophagus]